MLAHTDETDSFLLCQIEENLTLHNHEYEGQYFFIKALKKRKKKVILGIPFLCYIDEIMLLF